MYTHDTPHTHSTNTFSRPVQSRWELRDGRLRLRWSLGPGGRGSRPTGGVSFGEARAFRLLHGDAGSSAAAGRDGRLDDDALAA